MKKNLIKRLFASIFVLLGVTVISFMLLRLGGGDPASLYAGALATPEEIEEIRVRMGLDQPLINQYFDYLFGLLQGDLGYSSHMKAPVLEVYLQKLPATVYLALSAILLAHVVSIPLGIFSAKNQGSLADNAGMVLGLLGISIPNFWMGLMLIIWLSLKVKLFPSGGMGGWKSVVLPAFTLGIDYIASLSRTTRSSMIDVIRSDYLRTARSKGVPENKVINKHALKNALIPIVTVSGTQLAGILGGSVTTETVFSWPGVGRLIVEAISYRDVKLATGALIMTTILSSIILLCVDILYAYIDPRLKAQYARGRKKK